MFFEAGYGAKSPQRAVTGTVWRQQLTMKKTKFAIASFAIFGAALGLSSAAQAQSGVYTIGSVGYTTINQDAAGFDLDFKEVGGAIRLGYQFTKNFAVEGGYDFFGTSKYTLVSGANSARLKQQLTGLSLGVVGRYPIGNMFALRGLLGYTQVKSKNTVTDVASGLNDSSSPKEKKAYLGIGFEYLVNKQILLVSDLRYVRLGETDSGATSNIVNTNVGLKVNF